MRTDSTMVPPKNSDLLQWPFHGCSKQGRMRLKAKYPWYSSACKGLSIDGVEVSRDTVFQEIRPGVGFETGDSFKKSWGGHRRTTLRWRTLSSSHPLRWGRTCFSRITYTGCAPFCGCSRESDISLYLYLRSYLLHVAHRNRAILKWLLLYTQKDL